MSRDDYGPLCGRQKIRDGQKIRGKTSVLGVHNANTISALNSPVH